MIAHNVMAANEDYDRDIPDERIVTNSDSAMRLATNDSKSQRRKNRKDRILARRGAFMWLPVYFSNDLVHGSWWFVIGSIVATLIPIVPLIDLFYPFWETDGSSLPLLQDAATFILLIVSGLFFTLGSLAFVRATEEPPLRPLFANWTHFCTDELLAAWLFLFGTIPFPAFIAVYVYYNTAVLVYWGSLIGSIIFVIASYFFVLACYPTDEPRKQIIPNIIGCCISENHWLYKHLCNDWLAGTWLFFWGSFILCVGSVFMLYLSLQTQNNLDIFDWATSTIDSIIFLIGCAYFCAGSYPQESHSLSIDEKNPHGVYHYTESDPLLFSGRKDQSV